MAKAKTNNRPPIITVMGHIDHGKTTLLDALRQSNLTQQESGGITQHIGAYQIEHQGRKLTFIDTPGHAAFAAMRSRGAQVTDLVILVIDAVESVKPQTKECLDHINSAKVPFLVAINKIDLPNASPDIVKKDLADVDVLVEGYGGDIVCVEVSAKTKKGLDQLLEMTLLLADMQNLKADPHGSFNGAIIESSLDQKRGPLATIIVKNGTLKIKDNLQAENSFGKVRALFNENNQRLTQVLPGQAAQVLGFKQVPPVGSPVTSPEAQSPASPVQPTAKGEPPSPSEEGVDTKRLKIILKADAAGTLEAITQNLGDEVTLVSQGIGNVTESDVLLADSTSAKILAFRVKIISAAKKLADIEGIFIKQYSLIHELLDDVQGQILKLLEPTIDEKIIGQAKIIAEFTVKGQSIAGCQVESGKFTTGSLIHLQRDKETLADSKIKSIHLGKESVDKAKKGEDCGVLLSPQLDFRLKDRLIAYQKLS